MKRLLLAFSLLASPAFAQQTPPTVEDVSAQYYLETGALRQIVGQQMQALKARDAEIAKLKAELAAKPSEPATK